jgi:copper chaperone
MVDSIKLTVTGMKCGGCEKTIVNKLMAEEGVVKVGAKYAENEVEVEFEDHVITQDELIDCIENAGFTVQD